MTSPKDMRLGAYEMLTVKMRSRFQTACDIPLPRDLKDIIFEYYNPTEVEHFECVLQTGFVKGTVLYGGKHSTMGIESNGRVEPGILFKGRSGKVSYGSHRIKWIMSEFDSRRLCNIVEFHLRILFDAESYNRGEPFIQPNWKLIEKQMYSSFKRAAGKYMHRILRSKNDHAGSPIDFKSN
jgi:hypothetical protein